MSEDTAQPSRRSWNHSLFQGYINASSPIASSIPSSPVARMSGEILLQRQSSRGSRHKNAPSIDYSKSGHKRNSSLFSASQYSSPATTISRPGTPDLYDYILSDGISDLDLSKRPISGLSQSTKSTHSHRYSASAMATRQSFSEQGRLLQEKLQFLARSENARLAELEKVSVASSPMSSRPISLVLSEKGGVSLPASSQIIHDRTSSLQHFSVFDQSEHASTQSSPRHSTTAGISKDIARAAALATLSGGSPTLTRQTSRKSAEKRRRSAKTDSSFFIITDDQLETIGNETPKEAGPVRPGDIGGTVLSWRMAGDVIKAWVLASKSPEALFEIAFFVWAMLSNPRNLMEISLLDSKWLPPAEIVLSLKENVTSTLTQASLQTILDSLAEFGKLLGRGFCTGFAFMVIFLQVSLLSFMVVAYVLGDMLMSPARFVRRQFYGAKDKEQDQVELSPEEQTKASILKAQRTARKAIARRSKNRSRHHNH